MDKRLIQNKNLNCILESSLLFSEYKHNISKNLNSRHTRGLLKKNAIISCFRENI